MCTVTKWPNPTDQFQRYLPSQLRSNSSMSSVEVERNLQDLVPTYYGRLRNSLSASQKNTSRLGGRSDPAKKKRRRGIRCRRLQQERGFFAGVLSAGTPLHHETTCCA